jgi:hypothetical protein
LASNVLYTTTHISRQRTERLDEVSCVQLQSPYAQSLSHRQSDHTAEKEI